MNIFLLREKGEHRIAHSILVTLQRLWFVSTRARIDVEALLSLCNLITTDDDTKLEYLKALEEELDYMMDNNIISGWRIESHPDCEYPSQTDKPFNCVLTITQPDKYSREKGCCD